MNRTDRGEVKQRVSASAEGRTTQRRGEVDAVNFPRRKEGEDIEGTTGSCTQAGDSRGNKPCCGFAPSDVQKPSRLNGL